MIKLLAKVDQGWQINSKTTLINFPAGEVHLDATDSTNEKAIAALVSGTNLEDYMALIQWADIIQSRNEKTVGLIPYLPGARADRGHPFGAKAYADIINNAQLDQVICLDPHSHVMPQLVKNITIVESAEIIKNAVLGKSELHGYVGIIAPDAGAVERAEKVAKLVGLPLYKAEKHRDFHTGKLSHFTCEPLPEKGRLLVVDDICDGGKTFLGLAEVTKLPRERLSLWVTHGVFSGEANKLTEKYGQIYTTDSLESARRSDVGAQVVPILRYLLQEIKHTN